MDMTTDGDLQNAQADAASDENQSSGIMGQVFRSATPRDSRTQFSSPGAFPVASWDRYEFLSLLGQGGMGAVYKARDRRIHRLVALKFIRGGDERLTRRFMQEARAQARIDHPGICKVLEVGEVEGKAYIAMQFIDGESLQQAKLGLSQIEKLQLVKETAEALHAAHELGIIHRDIKPAKVTSVEKQLRSVRMPSLSARTSQQSAARDFRQQD